MERPLTQNEARLVVPFVMEWEAARKELAEVENRMVQVVNALAPGATFDPIRRTINEKPTPPEGGADASQ